MPPLGYGRTVVAAGESSAPHVVPGGRAARGTLRSLALLVDRMATLGTSRDGAQGPDAATAVRDALRQFTARVREAPLLCRIHEQRFVLDWEPVDRGLTRDDPLLGTLLFRCLSLGVGGITVRQGAAPAELLTLATLLARRRTEEDTLVMNDTPTSMSAVAEQQPRELLRSWSVLVTPADHPGGHRLATPPDGARGVSAGASSMPTEVKAGVSTEALQGAGPTLVRLAAATDDMACSRVVDALVPIIDQAEYRGDARLLEQVAVAAARQAHVVAGGGGRLALERVMRRLQHRSSLELLAGRLPYVEDRTMLLELLARAGETAVDILVKQLMQADDGAARRVYFDSIVQLDIAGPTLFDHVRDSRWFVVRNAVALLGEMGIEQADLAMLPLLHHADERIRVAVARSLVRLGTVKALQGLHAAIDDASAEVRRIAAISYGLTPGTGTVVRPPALRLAMALEKETNEDVALEMLASLGKLGSADAVQRLLRLAMPQQQVGDTGEAPREAWLRIAALEALVKARGSAVMPHVETLMNDADPEVAQAAFRLRG
ncbi:HEAT repeat domain-containing protein [Gemmatimonas sp.]|uniref:HEAT repeat domain-containing protein n=1 Tax=Gemmatimonas sp. TaxID=1962908 RepID=UPI0022BB896D|nr:HEAT repeat domain-containing protein [Gemmatimonas sp.]MCZ8204058.1 HEAT repeat domain-containing protein [Gemmatimonas sp.]